MKRELGKFKSLRQTAALAVLLAGVIALARAEGEKYVVVRGDTLWDVAEMLYNNPYRWTEIYDLNKDTVKDPNLIYPEQMLWVKDAAGNTVAVKVMAEEKAAEVTEAKEEEKMPEEPAKEEAKAPEAVVAAEGAVEVAAAAVEEVKEEAMPEPEEETVPEPAIAAPRGSSHKDTMPKGEFKKYDGRIITFADTSRYLVSQGDIVYVDIGEKDGLIPGDELWVVRKVKQVSNKKTGSKFWVLEKRGKMKVTSEIYDNRAACRIVFSHFPLDVGDGVVRAVGR